MPEFSGDPDTLRPVATDAVIAGERLLTARRTNETGTSGKVVVRAESSDGAIVRTVREVEPYTNSATGWMFNIYFEDGTFAQQLLPSTEWLAEP